MELPDMAPYYTDWVETGAMDALGPIAELVTAVDGRSVHNWLQEGVLGAIREKAVGGQITHHPRIKEVSTPLGDLYVGTHWGHVTFARFATVSALVGQAAEYKLRMPWEDRDYGMTIFQTRERNGKRLEESFDAFDSFWLYDRNPVAIRFAEMVSLVTANATPNFDIAQRWYQLAA